ncbi:hypothetical protein E3N88_17669 [Mikania micrantha]|uniref:Uncharacterized protein n=1 Tax=Mikania micrantha TaxID=192012 RepID=A0A5N6NUB2_9ASTR|nr:hypothetical protein E3N88_17669 [Mikania micrantha]
MASKLQSSLTLSFKDLQWPPKLQSFNNGGFAGEMMKKQRRNAWRGSPRPGVPRGWKMCPADFLVPRASPDLGASGQAYRVAQKLGPLSLFCCSGLVLARFSTVEHRSNIVWSRLNFPVHCVSVS